MANNIPTVKLCTGETIPCIGMGTFGSDYAKPAEVASAVDGAIRYGYRLFDCASVYENEKVVGDIFNKAIREGIVERSELFITSKVWNDKHNDVIASCLSSLADLDLKNIDAYFVHWPFPNYHAPFCKGDSRNPDSVPFSIEEYMRTWRQMEQLYDMGLVRNLGMSNMTIPKLEALLPLCRIQPVLLEMEMHPSFQQEALFRYAQAHNIQTIGYSPIGNPKRPERDKEGSDITDIKMPELLEIAERHGVHPAIICIRWAVQRGAIPIPFSITERNYRANLDCVADLVLTSAEMDVIRGLERNNRLVKGQVFLWPTALDWHELWDEDGFALT